MVLRTLLPEHHLSQDSRDVVKLGMGLIGTITALVLGLLIASAKSSFDAQRNTLAQLSANLTLLDRILAHYGPETKECREQLKENLTGLLEQLWPEKSDQGGKIEPTTRSESLYERIQGLTPQTDAQRSLQAAALKTGVDVAQARWLLSAQQGSSIPVPFLVVLVFWLALLFASFSMFARPNATVVVVLLLCALSVSGAIFLILELDRPFGGLIQLSSEPLRRVLEQLGH
jgi:hypothetical protein